MGQFTTIKRHLRAGIDDIVNVEGSFLYITRADGNISLKIQNTNTGNVGELEACEGFTWSADPMFDIKFNRLTLRSEIDQFVIVLVGFGRVTNENTTVTTSPGEPLDVKVVESVDDPINVLINNSLINILLTENVHQLILNQRSINIAGQIGNTPMIPGTENRTWIFQNISQTYVYRAHAQSDYRRITIEKNSTKTITGFDKLYITYNTGTLTKIGFVYGIKLL